MYTCIQRHRHTQTGIYTHSPTDGHRHTGITNSDSPRRAVNTKAICLPSDGKHAGVIKISEHRETGQATHPQGEGPEAGHICHAWIQATKNSRGAAGHTWRGWGQALGTAWEANQVGLAERRSCRPGQGGPGGGDALTWQCAGGPSAWPPNALSELGGRHSK